MSAPRAAIGTPPPSRLAAAGQRAPRSPPHMRFSGKNERLRNQRLRGASLKTALMALATHAAVWVHPAAAVDCPSSCNEEVHCSCAKFWSGANAPGGAPKTPAAALSFCVGEAGKGGVKKMTDAQCTTGCTVAASHACGAGAGGAPAGSNAAPASADGACSDACNREVHCNCKGFHSSPGRGAQQKSAEDALAHCAAEAESGAIGRGVVRIWTTFSARVRA